MYRWLNLARVWGQVRVGLDKLLVCSSGPITAPAVLQRSSIHCTSYKFHSTWTCGLDDLAIEVSVSAVAVANTIPNRPTAEPQSILCARACTVCCAPLGG